MPPMLIFPRKRMQQEFELNVPPGEWTEVHETGWMTKPFFSTWSQKFLEVSGVWNESPVLLLLDGQGYHTKSLEMISLGREDSVVLLCFPPHCTHTGFSNWMFLWSPAPSRDLRRHRVRSQAPVQRHGTETVHQMMNFEMSFSPSRVLQMSRLSQKLVRRRGCH